MADVLKRKTANARLYIGIAIPVLAVPFALGFLYTDSVLLAYICSFVFSILSPAWIGSATSTVNDLVMPRMRATASAYYVLMNTFLGLALGPYLIGQISDLNIAAGMAPGEALRAAATWGLAAFGFSALFLIAATRYLANDEGEDDERRGGPRQQIHGFVEEVLENICLGANRDGADREGTPGNGDYEEAFRQHCARSQYSERMKFHAHGIGAKLPNRPSPDIHGIQAHAGKATRDGDQQ